MSSKSREYILTRRSGTGFDFSKITLANGNLTVDYCAEQGIWNVNSNQMVGIATATEVGLTPDRYPIRVIVGANPGPQTEVETCVRFWRVFDATHHSVKFQRRPFDSDLPVRNLYKVCPDLDDFMWDLYGDGKDKQILDTLEANMRSDQIYVNCCLAQLTTDITAQTAQLIREHFEEARNDGRWASFKISDNAFMASVPSGNSTLTNVNVDAKRNIAIEAAATIRINYDRISKRYEGVGSGAIVAAAHTIAAMFRYSLFEAYEHQEFYTVVAAPHENNPSALTISEVICHKGAPAPKDLAVGNVIDISGIKIHEKLLQLGPALVVSSGVNHYMFNHTTGGSVVSGPLLTTLSMYQIISKGTDTHVQETITDIFYEALHPANKRAIANMFFAKSGVTTHGRMTNSHRYERFVLDTFMNIRMQPYPAGSHKAFLTVTALKRVIKSGLSAFLPWAGQMNDCVQMCKEVLTAGARAHIGSHYYTGTHAVSQPAALDEYLPELACYLHNMCKGDSLSYSPHFSPEVSAKASVNWANLLRDIKGNDVSATSVDVVAKYLRSSGAVFVGVDPNDETTWGEAAAAGNAAAEVIDNLFH